MANSTTMQYGSYSFSPVPFVRLSRQVDKTAVGDILGFSYIYSLLGDLVVPSGSIVTIDQLQDELASGLATQGQLFEVECGGNVLISAYPKVNSLEFTEGNWVQKCSFSAELQAEALPPGTGTAYISSFNESWDFQFNDEKTEFTWNPGGSTEKLPYSANITHNLSATGKNIYNSGTLVKPAWQQARNFLIPYLGIDNEFVEQSGIINLNSAGFSPYNHFRTVQESPTDGTVSITETWLMLGSGAAGHATEDFNMTVSRESDSALYNVSIDGSIQGLESRTYGTNPNDFSISETKYAAASGAWNTIKSRLLSRADLILDTMYTTRNLNSIPLSQSVAHDVYRGTIGYNYSYNTRASNCLVDVDGNPVLSETIVIADDNQVDIFAQIFILGKAGGPVLQDLGTKNAGVRTLTIECVVPPPTGCPTSASAVTSLLTNCKPVNDDDIVDAITDEISDAYSSFYISQDSSSSSLKDGRYNRTVVWTYSSCN